MKGSQRYREMKHQGEAWGWPEPEIAPPAPGKTPGSVRDRQADRADRG